MDSIEVPGSSSNFSSIFNQQGQVCNLNFGTGTTYGYLPMWRDSCSSCSEDMFRTCINFISVSGMRGRTRAVDPDSHPSKLQFS